jgi:hypothetical protein
MLFVLLARSLLAGLTVTLPAQAQVRGAEIELGELGELASLDRDMLARARAVAFGYAPAPGFTRVLTAERVRAELARALPEVSVRVLGESTCRVQSEVEELASDVVEGAARLELRRAFAGLEATFTPLDRIPSLDLPRGLEGSELRARVPAGPRTSGKLGVPVEVWLDGQCYRTLWTNWRVDVWETRPVSSPGVTRRS